jgi:hypothetical protein
MSNTCQTCRHWERLSIHDGDEPDADDIGVCNSPAEPWRTPERIADLGDYAAAIYARETCPLWEGKP